MNSTIVQIAFFLAVEVDGVPQVVLESPDLTGKVSEEETRVIVALASRLLGQDLVLSTDNSDTCPALVVSDQDTGQQAPGPLAQGQRVQGNGRG